MGLGKDRNIYIYDLVYDGHIERESDIVENGETRFSERLEFCHRSAFVAWLERQTDKSLSGADNDDAFYRDNQRLTVQRLRDFVDGWNPAVKDECRLSVIFSEVNLRRAARMVTWREPKEKYFSLLNKFYDEPVTRCILRGTCVEFASSKTQVVFPWPQVAHVWLRREFWVFHIESYDLYKVVSFDAVENWTTKYLKSWIGFRAKDRNRQRSH